MKRSVCLFFTFIAGLNILAQNYLDYSSSSEVRGICTDNNQFLLIDQCYIKVIVYDDSLSVEQQLTLINNDDKNAAIKLGVPWLRTFADLSEEQLLYSKNKLFELRVNNKPVHDRELALSSQFLYREYLNRLCELKSDLEWQYYYDARDSIYAYYDVDTSFVYEHTRGEWNETRVFPSAQVKNTVDSLLRQRNVDRISRGSKLLKRWIEYCQEFENNYPVFTLWQHFNPNEKKVVYFHYLLPSGYNLSIPDQSYRNLKIPLYDYVGNISPYSKILIEIDISNIDATSIENFMPENQSPANSPTNSIIRIEYNGNDINKDDFIYFKYRIINSL